MTVGIDLASITTHSTGFALNASEFNAPISELNTAFQNGSKDFYPRQIVIEMNTGEDINAGEYVRVSSNTILKVVNTSVAGISNFLGCALETKTSGNACKVAINAVYGLSGLTAGATYYIGSSGAITATKPSSNFAQAIGYAISTSILVFANTVRNSDLNIFHAVNDGNPKIRLGSSSAEEFQAQSVYDSGAQTLDYVLFKTKVASATANKGQYKFNVDESDIIQIRDDGINLEPGKGLLSGGTSVLAFSSGNVGFGEASPAEKIHTSGTTGVRIFHSGNTLNDEIGVTFGTTPGTRSKAGIYGINLNTGNAEGGLVLKTNSGSGLNSVMWVTGSGNIGINEAYPSFKLGVNGHIGPETDDTYNLGSGSLRFSEVYATNTTIQTSDERLKDNIEDISLGLEFILSLSPKSYKWKDREEKIVETQKKIAVLNEETKQIETETVITKKIIPAQTHSRKHFGLIAQDVEKIITDLGISTNDFAPFIHDKDSDRYGLRYGEFIPILIKAIHDLNTKIEELVA